MYVMEVRHDGQLVYKLSSLELADIVNDLIDWLNVDFASYEVRIFEVPRMIVEVSNE